MKIKLDSLQDAYSAVSLVELFAKGAQQATLAAWLKSYVDALEQFTHDIIKHKVDISMAEQDIDELKQVADMYEVILFNLQKSDGMDEFLNEMLTKAHNEIMTTRQYIIGSLGLGSYVYNSEINIQKALNTSMEMLDNHKVGDNVEFVEV